MHEPQRRLLTYRSAKQSAAECDVAYSQTEVATGYVAISISELLFYGTVYMLPTV